MKAEELMLGDWCFCELNGKPEKVQAIYEDKVMLDYNDLYPYDEIQPIPITKEILEKNEFVIKKKWAQMGNFGDSPLIMWHFEDEPILRDFKHELEIHQNDTGKVHIQIPCEYVHELQNALRLCGIAKEIEL